MSVIHGPLPVSAVKDSIQRDTTAKHVVGSQIDSEDGRFLYVTAGGAITTSGDPVSVSGALTAVLRGDLDTGSFIGYADAPFASGESGWIRTRGPASMIVESGAVAGAGLQLSATVGKLKTITTSGTVVAIALAAANDDSATRVAVYIL